jgi:hypothetical protein
MLRYYAAAMAPKLFSATPQTPTALLRVIAIATICSASRLRS